MGKICAGEEAVEVGVTCCSFFFHRILTAGNNQNLGGLFQKFYTFSSCSHLPTRRRTEASAGLQSSLHTPSSSLGSARPRGTLPASSVRTRSWPCTRTPQRQTILRCQSSAPECPGRRFCCPLSCKRPEMGMVNDHRGKRSRSLPLSMIFCVI